MPKTAYSNSRVLNYTVLGIAPTAFTPYLGLLTTVDPVAPVEVTTVLFPNYAPIALSAGQFNAITLGTTIQLANSARIAFAAAGAGANATIVGWGIKDNATPGVGNWMRTGYLTGPWFPFTLATANTMVLAAPGHTLIAGAATIQDFENSGQTVYGSSVPSGVPATNQVTISSVAVGTITLSSALSTVGAGRIAQSLAQTVTPGVIVSFEIGNLVIAEV